MGTSDTDMRGGERRVGDQPANTGALIVDFPVWGLFWRFVLRMVVDVLIIPAPWANTTCSRFVMTYISLPDGRRLTFKGNPRDLDCYRGRLGRQVSDEMALPKHPRIMSVDFYSKRIRDFRAVVGRGGRLVPDRSNSMADALV